MLTPRNAAELTPGSDADTDVLPDPGWLHSPTTSASGAQEGERESQLRFLTQADDARTARPPIVGPFRTKELGGGLRTLRHRPHGNGSLDASLRYAWRSEEYETARDGGYGTEVFLRAFCSCGRGAGRS